MTGTPTEGPRDARRETARKCVAAGIDAASPERAVREQVTLDGESLRIGDRTYPLDDYDRALVVGGGKASAAVARGLEAVLGDRLDGGLVVTDGDETTERVEVAVGDHPVPSERNVAATERVVDLLAAADERTLVLAPVTGGGSALLCAPTVALDDYRDLTDALVESGASIDEVNAVRRRLSRVKGGGLAETAAPATVVATLVSDVVGDDPAVVASGPFTPAATSAAEALAVLDRYDLDATAEVRDAIRDAAPADGPFEHVHTHLLVTVRTAVDAAADWARAAGYDPLVLSSRMRGEARENALAHVAVAEESLATGDPAAPPLALLSGGELTVTVRGDGDGGPNLEFALAAALSCPPGVTVASVDTDGRDGGTDVAGAVVDGTTLDDAAAARDALDRNDALSVLVEADAVLELDSETNVNDLRVVLVDRDERSPSDDSG
jgi:hydroxypyruvate reductase